MPVLMSKNEQGEWEQVGVNVEPITVDSALSETSENPVQNKVITGALKEKLSKTDIDSSLSPDSTNPVQNKVIDTALKAHVNNKNNPHGVTAAQIKARPDTWTPTAQEVGAVSVPEVNPSGVVGQVLRSKGNNKTEWAEVGNPTDEQVNASVNKWLDAHPDATTTVQPGSIGEDKLNTELAGKVNGKADKTYVNQTFANAFTTTVSGPVVAVDDVSPVEHQVGCKVERINLLDYYRLKNPYRWEWSAGYWKTKIPVKRGKTYTVFCAVKPVASNFTSLFVIAVNRDYADNTQNIIYNSNEGNLVTARVEPEGDYIALRVLANGSGSPSTGYSTSNEFFNIFPYDKLIIYEGTEDRDWVPYVPDLSAVTVTRQRSDGSDAKTYTPAPDSTVSGMTSLSPDMTILTDNPGVTLEATYNRDSNKVVQGLMDRIATLESAKTDI